MWILPGRSGFQLRSWTSEALDVGVGLWKLSCEKHLKFLGFGVLFALSVVRSCYNRLVDLNLCLVDHRTFAPTICRNAMQCRYIAEFPLWIVTLCISHLFWTFCSPPAQLGVSVVHLKPQLVDMPSRLVLSNTLARTSLISEASWSYQNLKCQGCKMQCSIQTRVFNHEEHSKKSPKWMNESWFILVHTGSPATWHLVAAGSATQRWTGSYRTRCGRPERNSGQRVSNRFWAMNQHDNRFWTRMRTSYTVTATSNWDELGGDSQTYLCCLEIGFELMFIHVPERMQVQCPLSRQTALCFSRLAGLNRRPQSSNGSGLSDFETLRLWTCSSEIIKHQTSISILDSPPSLGKVMLNEDEWSSPHMVSAASQQLRPRSLSLPKSHFSARTLAGCLTFCRDPVLSLGAIWSNHCKSNQKQKQPKPGLGQLISQVVQRNFALQLYNMSVWNCLECNAPRQQLSLAVAAISPSPIKSFAEPWHHQLCPLD